MSTKREQQLINLCFQIGLTLSTSELDRAGQPYDMTKLSREEKAKWIAEQLRGCGFDTKPMGMSWGVLVD